MGQRLQHAAALLAGTALLLLLCITLSPEPDPPAAGIPKGTAEASPPPLDATAESSLPTSSAVVASLEHSGTLLFLCGTSICLADASGTSEAVIEPEAPNASYMLPRWSPDGETFATALLRIHRQESGEAPTAEGTSFALSIEFFSAAGDRLTAIELLEDPLLRSVAQLVWSPDGRYLAVLARSESEQAPAMPRSRAWILSYNRQPSQALAVVGEISGAIDAPLVWSPDGDRLAFVREQFGAGAASEPALTIFDLERLQEQLIAPGRHPVWSPDGGRLAFVREQTRLGAAGRPAVIVFDLERLEERPIAPGRHPAWVPDSSRLSFVADDGTALRMVDLLTEQERSLLMTSDLSRFLVAADPPLLPEQVSLTWPVWSPAGDAVAFRLQGRPRAGWSRYIPGMLFTASTDGGAIRRWPDTDTPNTSLQLWAPSGRYLIYPYWLIGQERFNPNNSTAVPANRFSYSCTAGLILVDLEQNSYREEACGSTGIDLQAFGSWSPDGEIFATRSGSAIALFSAGNPLQRRIVPARQPHEIQWRPGPARR